MPFRLLLFVDPRSKPSATLLAAALRAARGDPGLEIVAVVDANPSPMLRGSLHRCAWLARRHGVPLIVPRKHRVNDEAFVARVRDELRPDGSLTLMVVQPFHVELLRACGAPANYHNGLLPRYRGIRATGWSVYEGEARSGFSFHRMTTKIDDGPILLQDAVDVPTGATGEAVERAKTKLAAERMGEALALLAAGDPGRPQEGEPSSFTFADLHAIRDVVDPSTLTWDDFERRVRAFGGIELAAGGQRLVVDAVRRAADGRGTFTTADGMPVELVRARSLRSWRHWLVRFPAHTQSGHRNHVLKALAMVPGRLCLRALHGRLTVVAITGSAGKTTTKRLTAAVLATAGRTRADLYGSRNTTRGLLRAILTTTPLHRFAVHELGAFGRGTLDELLWLVAPDVAVITNVGGDHRAAFGGPEGVAREKSKVVAALPPDGIAVLNADDENVRAMAQRAPGRRIVLYGEAPDADVRGEDVGVDERGYLRFTLVCGDRRVPVATRLTGAHWLNAALAAIATGIAVGVEPEAAARAVAGAEPQQRRLSRRETPRGITFLQDDVKASEWTIGPALDALGGVPGERKIVVLGQLSDTTRTTRKAYRDIAALARARADLVVLVGQWARYGELAREAPDDTSIIAFPGRPEAEAYLRGALREGDVVLVKATPNDDRLEELPDALGRR